MKQLKDYLHFYLGCEVIFNEKLIEGETELRRGVIAGVEGDAIGIIPIRKNGEIDYQTRNRRRIGHFQLLLRPLSDITEEEKAGMGYPTTSFKYVFGAVLEAMVLKPIEFIYLLSKHFDLFNLIPDGLAIDRTKLNSELSDERSVASKDSQRTNAD